MFSTLLLCHFHFVCQIWKSASGNSSSHQFRTASSGNIYVAFSQKLIGSLSVRDILLQASFHVVLISTHCFDKTIVNTVIQNNINPIEKVERSVLIVASAIHQKPAAALVQPEHLERLQGHSPALFDSDLGATNASVAATTAGRTILPTVYSRSGGVTVSNSGSSNL
jgi:hypothetical protein